MKVQNPIIGRSRGSAGGMTFCKNYDKNVARAKAFEVSNPNTPAQQDQRDFFKEVAGIVATVSEEELRSLFGVKPKAMSRRNALSKQVAAAYSIVEGQKVVDFSKLQAIGNGQKVTTPIALAKDGEVDFGVIPSVEMFGSNAKLSSQLFLVDFNVTRNSIQIFDTGFGIDDLDSSIFDVQQFFGTDTAYCYLTIESNGKMNLPSTFGGFTLKTRATGKESPAPTPTPDLSIYANGRSQGSYFHFTDAHFDSSADKLPTLLKSGDTVVCSNIDWDDVNNWWGGTLAVALSENQPVTLVGDDDGTTIGPLLVDWVVQ